jgi:hypothetical protein
MIGSGQKSSSLQRSGGMAIVVPAGANVLCQVWGRPSPARIDYPDLLIDSAIILMRLAAGSYGRIVSPAAVGAWLIMDHD